MISARLAVISRTMALTLAGMVVLQAFAAEVPVSQPAYGPASRDQYDAAVASDGDQYLVVWGDERAEVPQAYAARMARDGTLLDPHGIRVASGALTYYPSVIWGGSSWFVLANTCHGIELVRLARNGALLDAKPRVFPVNAWCPGLSMATDGRHIVIGYVSGYSSYEQHALILDSDGGAIADISLATGQPENVVPAIAWNGSFFVAVWGGNAVRFDANGTVGPARTVSLSGSAATTLRIASDGRDFVVVRGSLLFRLSADLVADPLGGLPFAYAKSIAWTGSGYVVAGVAPVIENGQEHQGNVNLVRLDREGRLLAQREVRTRGVGAHPAWGAAIATNGQNVLAAWHDPTDGSAALYPEADMYAATLSLPELTPEPRRLLSVAADWQLAPATAASGSNHLIVWQEATGLYARRHWRDGHTDDDAPLRLTAEATSVAVIFNGADFLVASTEGTAVVTRRLPVGGALRVDREWRSNSFSSQVGGKTPGAIALASSGGVTLAAWFDGGLHAARVGPDGALIDKIPLEVAPAPLADTTHRIAIAPNGDGELLVVWGGSIPGCIFCSPSTPDEPGVLRAARVTSTLTLLDRPPIELAIPTAAFNPRADPASPRYDPQHSLNADHPSATWNGSEWLVVWNRSFHNAVVGASPQEEIRGRRIARNGTVLDGSPSDPGVLIAANAYAPTVAWTGSGYLLAWYEGLPTYRVETGMRSLQSLHTASFDRLGGLLANSRTLGESPEADPVSLAVANGFISLAYARLGDDARYGGVPRVFLELPVAAARPRTVGR